MRGAAVELAPSRWGRLANSGLGVVPAAGSLVCTAQAPGAYPRLAGCTVLLVCVVIAVRGYRLGVLCRDAELTVRGYLWTRTILRGSITEITGFPAVRWTDSRGRGRWSPLWVFHTSSREPARTTAAKERNTEALRRWLRPHERRPTRR
ncbi:hypothetical protein ACFYZ8_21940 [Streptomyces sp. NPDC001668]|uniref:hypothetical protein n=1 Tax=unclassified Streptomyces TaxID=2593676 RepID=UPI0036882B1A